MAAGLDYPRSNYNKIRSVSLVMKHMDRQTYVFARMLSSCCTGSVIRDLPTNSRESVGCVDQIVWLQEKHWRIAGSTCLYNHITNSIRAELDHLLACFSLTFSTVVPLDSLLDSLTHMICIALKTQVLFYSLTSKHNLLFDLFGFEVEKQ
jgi:hypothetical protein